LANPVKEDLLAEEAKENR